MAVGLLIAALAWGAFAFGGFYPWGYWPLTGAVIAVGASGLLARSTVPRLEHRGLAIAFGAFVLAGLVQLIPLSFETIRAISPHAPDAIKALNPLAGVGLLTSHSLSIAPEHTTRGLAVCGALMFLVIGASRLFSIVGVRGIARGTAFLGAVLAFEGIVQATLTTRVYGFWTPHSGSSAFGPFVNRNHFAGWMLMALPLTLGLIAGALARTSGATWGLRDRLLWLSSREGSRLLFWIGAAVLMGLSVILTTSRSGMMVAALVLIATAARALAIEGGMARRIASAAVVCAAGAGIVAWIGADAIAARFGEASWNDVNMRKGAWLDAIAIANQYPLVGTGFNTYGVATLLYQQHYRFWHFVQAHNDYLQLAAEGGLLMVLPAVAAIVLFGVGVRRRFREETSVSTSWIRAGAVTGICAIALQEIVDFSLQMPGNALLFAVLCAIALHRTPMRRRQAV